MALLDQLSLSFQQLINHFSMSLNLSGHSVRVYQLALIGITFLLAILVFIKLIHSGRRQSTKTESHHQTLSNKDIEMLAGDDVVTTQLDLARAYIEMGKNNLAKSILFHVSKQGNTEQQHE